MRITSGILILFWGFVGCAHTGEHAKTSVAQHPNTERSIMTTTLTATDIHEMTDGARTASSLLVVDLIAIASDTSKSPGLRREAIFALGRAGTTDAIGFLVGNLEVNIPLEAQLLDGDQLKAWPCLYALWDGDCRHAFAILSRTKSELSTYERLMFASALQRILGVRRTIALLQSDRSVAESPVHEANLTAIELVLTPPQ